MRPIAVAENVLCPMDEDYVKRDSYINMCFAAELPEHMRQFIEKTNVFHDKKSSSGGLHERETAVWLYNY